MNLSSHIKEIDNVILFLSNYKYQIKNNIDTFNNSKYNDIYKLLSNDIYNLKDRLLYLMSCNNEIILDSNLKNEILEYNITNQNLKRLMPIILMNIINN